MIYLLLVQSKLNENIFKSKNASDKVFVLLTDKAISLERFDCRHARLGPNDKTECVDQWQQNTALRSNRYQSSHGINIALRLYDFTIETLNEAIKQLDLLLVLILKRFCSTNTDLTCSAVTLKSYELIKTSGS